MRLHRDADAAVPIAVWWAGARQEVGRRISPLLEALPTAGPAQTPLQMLFWQMVRELVVPGMSAALVDEAQRTARRTFQRRMQKMLRPSLRSHRAYLLKRFRRWGCGEALVARLFAAALLLKKVRLPRRGIATLNGLFTARRMQQPERPCLFGCNAGADDLEHLFCCPRIIAALAELRVVHPQGDWLGAWILGPTAFGIGPYCSSRDQTFVLLCMWIYEAHNDLRHHPDGNSFHVRASITAFFSEYATGRSRPFRAWRASQPPSVLVPANPPAQPEGLLAALPAPPILVLARRDGDNGAAGLSAQG